MAREQLLEYAKMATEVRAAINEKAKRAVDIQIASEPSDPILAYADDIKLHRTYTPMRAKRSKDFVHSGLEEDSRPGSRRRAA